MERKVRTNPTWAAVINNCSNLLSLHSIRDFIFVTKNDWPKLLFAITTFNDHRRIEDLTFLRFRNIGWSSELKRFLINKLPKQYPHTLCFAILLLELLVFFWASPTIFYTHITAGTSWFFTKRRIALKYTRKSISNQFKQITIFFCIAQLQ